MVNLKCTGAEGNDGTSMRSSTVDDTDDVRTSRLGAEVGQDATMTLHSGLTLPHSVSHSHHPVIDYRGWPRLDVTMATRIQPSSTAEIGKYCTIRDKRVEHVDSAMQGTSVGSFAIYVVRRSYY